MLPRKTLMVIIIIIWLYNLDILAILFCLIVNYLQSSAKFIFSYCLSSCSPKLSQQIFKPRKTWFPLMMDHKNCGRNRLPGVPFSSTIFTVIPFFIRIFMSTVPSYLVVQRRVREKQLLGILSNHLLVREQWSATRKEQVRKAQFIIVRAEWCSKKSECIVVGTSFPPSISLRRVIIILDCFHQK